MLEHKFAENGVFFSNGARKSRTAIWGVKSKENPRKGLYLTIILPGGVSDIIMCDSAQIEYLVNT